VTRALHLIGYSLLAVLVGLCVALLLVYCVFVFVEFTIEERT